jgi:hypothetical protein
VWVRNLDTNIKGKTKAESVYELGAGEDIGPTREKVTGDWKRFHGEEVHDSCCLQDTRMTTSRTKRYAKRKIRTGAWENEHRVWVRKQKGRRTTWNPWV